jgi:hypothetical protein
MVVLLVAGCHSSGPVQAAAALSGPPKIDPLFGSREPRRCTAATQVPGKADAETLVQCAKDGATMHNYLVQAPHVITLGPGRPFNYNLDSSMENIDTGAKVYPITGSFTLAQCSQISDYMQNAGKNCTWTDVPRAKGACYRTSNAGWSCFMNGDPAPGMPRTELVGPKDYTEVH